MTSRHDALSERARRAEAAIARVRARHHHDLPVDRCSTCGVPWPCPDICALNGPPYSPDCAEWHAPHDTPNSVEPLADYQEALARVESSGPRPETATETVDGWTREDDGIWTLPVDDGHVLMSRQTTPEERARFAEEWKRGQKIKPCEDCIAGAHGPNHHRKHLPPPRITPAEHCGEPNPSALSTEHTECVLRPSHSGSHTDDRGCRWWPTPEAVDWRQRAEQAENLLRVAHETSNKSETERARAVQRAEQAEAAIERVRAKVAEWREWNEEETAWAVRGIEDAITNAPARQPLDDAEQQRDQIAAVLREVLDAFETYWGRSMYEGFGAQAPVQPEHFRRWRAVLNQPKER